MWGEALKLSNSRALVAGAVVIDTLCFGTLAVLLISPGLLASASTGVLVLAALAITAPVFGLAVSMSSLIVPPWLNVEERARRCILAGATVHAGVQTATLLAVFCGRRGGSLGHYFVETFSLTFILTGSLLVAAFFLRRSASRRRAGVWPSSGDADGR